MKNRGSRPAGPGRGVLLAAGYLLYLPVLAGFVLHTSPGRGAWRVFNKYSPAYGVFLAALVAAGVVWPWAVRALRRPTRVVGRDGRELVLVGWRKVRFAAAGGALVLLAAGVLVEVGYQALGAPGPRRPPRPTDWEVFFDQWPARGGRINSRGFQGPETGVTKPPGTYRIFALGGSTTYLLNDMNQEDTFIHRLGESLARARPDWRFEVINAACFEHSTFQSLVKYAVLVQDFQPDLVLHMEAINDAFEGVPYEAAEALTWRAGLERDYSHSRMALARLGQESGLGRPQVAIWERSVVARQVVRAFDAVFLSDLRGRDRLTAHERKALAEWQTCRTLPMFRRNLRTLGQLVQANGGRFVVLSQPTMFRPEGTDSRLGYLRPEDERPAMWGGRLDVFRQAWVVAMRRYNDANREVAEALGATFVDLEAVVPARWEYFKAEQSDGIHMSPAGSALVAGAIERAIQPLIPPGPLGGGPSAASRPAASGPSGHADAAVGGGRS